MAKFKATFEGYPEDLVRVVGMSMNGLIRRIAEENEAKGTRSTFLRPETATPEWLMNHIVEQVAIALFQRPTEKRSINELAIKVIERYRSDIEGWIEENKVNLAEIGFLFPDAQAEASETRMAPPTALMSPVTPAVPAKPAPPASITGFICRRGRK
jgi:hypothetical protein